MDRLIRRLHMDREIISGGYFVKILNREIKREKKLK